MWALGIDIHCRNTVKDDIIPKNNETHDSIARKPRVVRAVSMCEAMPPSPDARFKSPTCSWPRGILKRRSRSLSESQLGSFLPLESISSLESSLDLGILDDQDGEESVEESISSSLGEKKSVRFNDVVSRQLFRSNSSILEQKARKQKKNMRRKKSRERHLSESDRDSDISQCFSDPGPCNDDISGTTTTSDDDDDETEVTTEVEDTPNINEVLKSIQKGATDNLSPDTVLDKKNNNSTVVYQNTTHHCDNDNASNNNINNNNKNDSKEESKTGKKKRKNNKKKDKKFEPSNNFIFQLDIEP
ncbi:hypothetical protein SK128_005395 [Halocaridina rubra]|uniref:Uncharacterized protein n=1 Tax=Halocaridina rubra TaxID=373956 RepID=A0AAN8X294_HALRR